MGNHLSGCNQIDGNDNPNTLHGGSGCDEIWSYGGHDEVYGHAGGDDLHLGSEYDWGHGGEGGDTISGGANGTSNFDELFGQDGPDNLQDEGIGSDADQLCGGNNDDVLNTYDGDNRDNLIGEGGSDSLYDGGDSDFKKQDGTCT